MAAKPERVPIADSPLADPADDRLGRAGFAKSLAKAIKNLSGEESIVVGLYGPWGSGKSTLLNFVEKELERNEAAPPIWPEQKPVLAELVKDDGTKQPADVEKPAPIVVRFNPWWFSGREQLLQQFFEEFTGALGIESKDAKFGELADRLGRYAQMLRPVKLALGVLPWVGEAVKAGADAIERVLETAGEAARMRDRGQGETVYRLKREIDNQIEALRTRIVVIIDEVDRLSCDEMAELFVVVRATACFPNTVFLLAFDHHQAAKRLGSALGSGIQDGIEYLEKIVQVQFTVPAPDTDQIYGFLASHLDSIPNLTTHKLWDDSEWRTVYEQALRHLLLTPRDVIRFASMVRVAYAGLSGEVNPVDFIGMTAVQVFAPELHRHIGDHRHMFASPYLETLALKKEDIRTWHEHWLGNNAVVPELLREPIERLVLWLFPDCGLGDAPRWEPEHTCRHKLRVSHSRHFTKYFALSLAADAMPEAEFADRILESLSNRELFARRLAEYASQLSQTGRHAKRFEVLQRLADHLENEPLAQTGDVETIVSVVFEIGDVLMTASESERIAGRYGVTAELDIAQLVQSVLGQLSSSKDRKKLLLDQIPSAKSLVAVATAVRELRKREEGDSTIRIFKPDEQLFDRGDFAEIQRSFADLVREQVVSGSLLHAFGLPLILGAFVIATSEKDAPAVGLSLTCGKVAFATLIQAFIDWAPGLRKFLSPGWLNPWMDAEAAKQRAARLLETAKDTLGTELSTALEIFVTSCRYAESGEQAWPAATTE